MKGLLLGGAGSTPMIWDQIKNDLTGEVDFVEYPHEILLKSNHVSDITTWVYETYKGNRYDYIAGHSMGGIIAMQLTNTNQIQCNNIILIETNIKPAEVFYRNLLMEENMKTIGPILMDMLKKEMPFYSEQLKKEFQGEFDYSSYIEQSKSRIFTIYGDRGNEHYENRYSDLNLSSGVIQKLNIHFVKNSCHMPMMENPKDFIKVWNHILNN